MAGGEDLRRRSRAAPLAVAKPAELIGQRLKPAGFRCHCSHPSPEFAEEGPFWMRSRLWLSLLTILANIAGVMGALAADQYLSDA